MQTEQQGRQVNVDAVIERLSLRVAQLEQQTIVQSVIIDELTQENGELKAAVAASADAAQPPAPSPEKAGADSSE